MNIRYMRNVLSGIDKIKVIGKRRGGRRRLPCDGTGAANVVDGIAI